MADTARHDAIIVDQHTQQASGYAALTRSMADERAAAFRQLIGVRADDVLLDVACGPGTLSLDLAPHIDRATGIDLTCAMLDEARAAQDASGCKNIDWVEGDAAALPFADASFSVVASRAAFHHFSRPAQVLAEMVRVCRPGGRVVIGDVTPELGKGAAYDRMEKMRDPSHGHAHSVEELGAMAREQGLAAPVVQTSFAGPMPYEAVLATSFPEEHSREELLKLMHADAETGEDSLGFRAGLDGGKVMVSYPMSTLVWTKG